MAQTTITVDRFQLTRDKVIEAVRKNLDDEDQTGERSQSSAVSIFKVPQYLIDQNKDAYVSRTVLLGPYPVNENFYYHQMEKHEVSALTNLIKRIKNPNSDARNVIGSTARSLVGTIMELEERKSYENDEAIPQDEETLACMLTLDACFILEFLRSFVLLTNGEVSKPLFDANRIRYTHGFAILRDIVKLQNQIPLIVLIKLLELETKSHQNAAEEKLLVMLYFGVIKGCYPFSPIEWTPELKSKLLGEAHILDVLSSVIVESFSEQESVPNSHCCALISNIEGFLCMPCPRKQPREEDIEGGSYTSLRSTLELNLQQEESQECHVREGASDESQENRQQEGTSLWHNLISNVAGFVRMPCSRNRPTKDKEGGNYIFVPSLRSAEILQRAEIEFAVYPNGSNKVKFDQNTATLYLPKIIIDDSAETVLRNLIALEVCRTPKEPKIVSSYMYLLDCLIDTERDVAILKEAGIIHSCMGSDREVAELFNRLCNQIAIGEYSRFYDEMEKVRCYYENQRKKNAREEYVKRTFMKPWQILSLFGGVLLLVLTATQTVFSILSFY